MSDPNMEAREAFDAIILRAEEGDPRTDWLPTIALLAREGLAALEQAGRALEQEREKVRKLDRIERTAREAADTLWGADTLRWLRMALDDYASSPGDPAAETEPPGACSECGVPPGDPHRSTCFFLTGDPADLLENQADG